MSSRLFSADPKMSAPTVTIEKVKSWVHLSNDPICVEIGCGVGLHPIQFAQNNQDLRLLAIERTSDKFKKFSGRIQKHSLNNLLGIQAEASRLLPFALDAKSVSRYFIFYPNPYPKASQKNLRWANAPFMHWIYDSLIPGGKITFATNIKSYAEEMNSRMPEYGFLCETMTEFNQPDFLPRTHFEKKYLAQGLTCYEQTFRKGT